MKGGGSSFGIVTNYQMKTHPQDHKVWGGNYFFTADKTSELLEAVHDFTANYPDDKAAIILTADHTPILNTWIMFLFYDGESPPDDVFEKFKAIGPTDATKTWDSYYDLLKNNDIFILKGQRYVIGTETTPLPSKDAASDVFQTFYDHWMNVTNNVLDVPNVIASMAFQPMPRTITKKAKELGGVSTLRPRLPIRSLLTAKSQDLIDFPTDQDYIILELDFSYSFASSDTRIDGAHQQLYNGLDQIISNYVDEGVLPDVYRPLFMNDAYHRQDYWGRLRTADTARETRERYDPEGFLQKRTSGGFRLK